ncbi:MAG TPA: MFS transporter [Gaiellaceae bacterium]|nr:MFS transporter [Gaiellaceae bacterium]
MSAPDPPSPPSRPSLVRRIAADVTPLRVSRDFRRIWLGLLVTELGFQFTLVATYYQVTELTGSTTAVGLIGLVGFVALVIGALVGSSILDAFDRRTLLIVSQFGYIAASGLLFAGALHGDPPIGLIYTGIGMLALVSAIEGPTRSAMTPRLVGRELVPSALALVQVVWNGTALLGPAIAGVVIAKADVAWAYGIDVVTYGAMLAAAISIRPMPPERGEGVARGWPAVKEGFGYLRGRKVLQSTFVIDIIAMVFGMPRALFPILALTQFHAGPEIVGLLFAAPAVGAFVGAITTGWVKHVRRQGAAVLWSVAVWGAGIAAFGLVGDNLPLALFFLALAGMADVISAVFRTTILQLTVPDALRGRISGIHILVVTGGPRLGDLEAGLVASAFTPTVSVVSGGLLCILGTAIVAWRVPAFRRYRAGDPA